MGLRYCFEQSKVLRTLSKSRKNDLAVINTDGISTAAIKAACSRGVWVYGYINAGALESEWSIRNKSNHFSL